MTSTSTEVQDAAPAVWAVPDVDARDIPQVDPSELDQVMSDIAALRGEHDELRAVLTDEQERRAEAEATMEAMRAQRDTAERDLHAARDAHRGDIALIGSVLLDEAQERDWCDEYDRVIDRLNDRLTVQLPVRVKDWEVVVKVSYNQEFLVTAHSYEEAQEMASQATFRRGWHPGNPLAEFAPTGPAYSQEVRVV